MARQACERTERTRRLNESSGVQIGKVARRTPCCVQQACPLLCYLSISPGSPPARACNITTLRHFPARATLRTYNSNLVIATPNLMFSTSPHCGYHPQPFKLTRPLLLLPSSFFLLHEREHEMPFPIRHRNAISTIARYSPPFSPISLQPNFIP